MKKIIFILLFVGFNFLNSQQPGSDLYYNNSNQGGIAGSIPEASSNITRNSIFMLCVGIAIVIGAATKYKHGYAPKEKKEEKKS